jgi:hypothetical protein
MGLRADLAAHLIATLPDGVTVYNVGAEVVATPAVVITFADPAQVVTTMQAGQAGLATALNLVLITNRGEPEYAADALEDLAYQVRQALRTFSIGTQAPTLSGLGDVAEVGGQMYPTATMETLFRGDDKGATIP